MTIEQLFFELIQVALGSKVCLSHSPTAEEWRMLYDIAKKQSLVGVCFAGVQRLVEQQQTPEEMLYLTWMGMAAMIQQRNEQMNARTSEAMGYFRLKGFPCQVLKGQGVATLYGELASLRQSGDVDVWVAGGRKKIYGLSKRMFGKLEGLTYYHIHYPMYDDCEVEAHIWPSCLASPIRNKTLKKFSMMLEPTEGCDDTPSLAFNRVYILLHCYKHFCSRGLGLRQVLDYYFVLLQGSTPEEKLEANMWIEKLGMKRFEEAIMWVMSKCFDLPSAKKLCSASEEFGRFVLSEIMLTGNMGHGDDRVNMDAYKTPWRRFNQGMRRSFSLLHIAPHEVLWSPFYKIWKYLWCKIQMIRMS